MTFPLNKKKSQIVPQRLLFQKQSCHHIETSRLICSANQLTGFYMMATLAFNELMNTTHNIT